MRTFPNSSDNDSPGDDYLERTPPPRQQRPPPPPPPPPRPWIMRVQLPNTNHHHQQQGMPHPLIRKIQVDGSCHNGQNVESFAKYLQHGLNLDYPPSGLFTTAGSEDGGDSDGTGNVFVSLPHILKLRDVIRQSQLFAVEYRPPPPPKVPWWKNQINLVVVIVDLIKYLVLPLVIAYYVMYHLESTILWTGVLTMSILGMVVHQVDAILGNLYHQGPWYLGFWEGGSLPSICARITYHGDAAFWYRNINECQVIFDTKRTAWLQIARPILYTILFAGGLSGLLWLIRA
jgi:hypothetical protein